jgi:hypothetical protein
MKGLTRPPGGTHDDPPHRPRATARPSPQRRLGARATLDLIASQANRAATLQALLDAEIASDATRPRLVVELAGELRQHEQSVARLTATLQPSGTGPAKSTQHQAAALTRWNRAG